MVDNYNPYAAPDRKPPPQGGGYSSEENQWAMLAHLSALAMFALPTLGQIVGPLIVWLIKKDELPLVDQHGKESLNFQISMTIYKISQPAVSPAVSPLRNKECCRCWF